jgi:hypothetical protein
MNASLAGEFVAAMYNKRRVLPSRGFWQGVDEPPRCPCCAEELVVTERPVHVVDAMSVWRAMMELRPRPPPIERWEQVRVTW